MQQREYERDSGTYIIIWPDENETIQYRENVSVVDPDTGEILYTPLENPHYFEMDEDPRIKQPNKGVVCIVKKAAV